MLQRSQPEWEFSKQEKKERIKLAFFKGEKIFFALFLIHISCYLPSFLYVVFFNINKKSLIITSNF